MNILIGYWQPVFDRLGARTEYRIEIGTENPIDPLDLTAILGNLLRNAAEAMERLAPNTERILRLALVHQADLLFLTMDNSFDGALRYDADGNLLSSKRAHGERGIGIESIRTSLARYDGTMEVTAEDGLFAVDMTLTIQMSSAWDMSLTALLVRPLALLYMTAVIRDHPLRILSIALLVYPLLLLASTLGTTMEFLFGEGLPHGLWKCLLIPMFFLLVLPAALHTIRHLLTPMLRVDDRRLWLYLCGYELILIALAVTADPSSSSVRPTIIAARLLLPFALIQYLRVSDLLTRYTEEGNALHQQQMHERMIRKAEEAHYHTMLEIWRRSRRMRHDLSHHTTMIAQLAREGRGEHLAAYLHNLAEQSAVMTEIKK